jgi:osmoprotectant transport system substrate-binding protein
MRNMTRLGAGVAAMALVAAACAEDDGNDEIEEGALAGASFTVGSKEFPEQEILGYIAILALQHADAEVQDETGISGSAPTRRALEAGEIDMYWEYTGTGWSVALGHDIEDAPADVDELYQAVAEEDLADNEIAWLSPAPMNNTYAIASAPGVASGLGVETLSDYAELASESPDDASLCAAAEFLVRGDGLPGVEETYDFELPREVTHEMELGIIHTRIPESDPCNFGEVFATDGEIIANELEVLEDDQGAFVPYNVAMTVRQDVYEEHQEELDAIFNPIAELLTDEVMLEMNGKVFVEGLGEEEVAQEFLEEHGFL